MLAGLSERVDAGTSNEVKVRPSLLPEEYTPIQNLLAGWYYCAYEPCDVGSEAHLGIPVESGRRRVLQAGGEAVAFGKALDTVTRLWRSCLCWRSTWGGMRTAAASAWAWTT